MTRMVLMSADLRNELAFSALIRSISVICVPCIWACPSQSLGSGYPLQVLARSSLRAFRYYPSREARARPGRVSMLWSQ
jgi:hypothetical protein